MGSTNIIGGQPEYPAGQPAEQQTKRPGRQHQMHTQPQSDNAAHKGSGKLAGRVALITGGDSGIGRALGIAFAKEGADVVISYLEEHTDAAQTAALVEEHGVRCLAVAGDVGDQDVCQALVRQVIDTFGHLDILINNAGEQHPQTDIQKITAAQLERTFRTNIFAMFFLVQAALPHLHEGAAIVNSASVTAYKGNPSLLDYSSTKGAIVAFTRSLSQALVKQGIRVNAVAPGPIWTPLIPSTFDKERVAAFGTDTPMGRAGQPEEVAMAYLFLASSDASYITGQTIHVNGGSVVNS